MMVGSLHGPLYCLAQKKVTSWSSKETRNSSTDNFRNSTISLYVIHWFCWCYSNCSASVTPSWSLGQKKLCLWTPNIFKELCSALWEEGIIQPDDHQDLRVCWCKQQCSTT